MITLWDTFPKALAVHGLPSQVASRLDAWRALHRLHDVEVRPQIDVPSQYLECVHKWLLHTGWSVLPFASWAPRSAEHGCLIFSGWLPGLRQMINRAESWALLQVLRWAGDTFVGELHVWAGLDYLFGRNGQL